MLMLAQEAGWLVAVAVGIVAALVGAGATYGVSRWLFTKRSRQTQSEADQITAKAQHDAEAILKEAKVSAKEEAIKARETFEKETVQTREEHRERERLVAKREDALESKMETLNRKEKTVEAG
jgi:ribonucrease Y